MEDPWGHSVKNYSPGRPTRCNPQLWLLVFCLKPPPPPQKKWGPALHLPTLLCLGEICTPWAPPPLVHPFRSPILASPAPPRHLCSSSHRDLGLDPAISTYRALLSQRLVLPWDYRQVKCRSGISGASGCFLPDPAQELLLGVCFHSRDLSPWMSVTPKCLL